MSARSWWNNCGAVAGDAEVAAIDALEDSIAPLDEETERIRRLITSFEACHHKAARWAELIVEAIGTGRTTKGMGRRPPGQMHRMETVWHHAIAALEAWCAGSAAAGTEYESVIVEQCPEYYREHAEFWRATARAVIHDTVDDEPATISLAEAIDHLEPCHWDFVENLKIVLAAIGGDLHPERPYATCARNIKRAPSRERMRVVVETLQAFCRDEKKADRADESIMNRLGEKTSVKHWLAASFEKTLRLQLDL